jgi:hypothetical protein|tara:strand:+ start:723 stop:881 length:159 start_codon:yes stop_codon:yes gene_type:complete
VGQDKSLTNTKPKILKDVTNSAISGVIGIAFLGILALCLLKEKYRDIKRNNP